mmetsp:Transcript_4350/g.5049  ORF Transcript_4350/g.5049 Transcript_4350/m.5049 type:complete len:322 (+) Transcript_4350:321-1286(+)|eukprot:CAMPEP_0184020206 /NCGR_PEP_ID=MMETSP0954-20121128/9213_1 /TAXON_ID=627963 /ORGANISM="Aplanochytrium sp, Strain PBS07" /LENGTH=321 /DNA_ID=CAMNT_0026302027 /DNA_START=398 /DNA_END=1363 /DNA_ORIENTATION=-
MPRSSLPPFLEKLARITNTIESSIASWSEDGKSFVIKNADKFELVLKQHFKGNAQTFIRQLHFYGFRKLDAQSSGGWSFAHPNFKKDCPQLLTEIRRKTRIDPTAENIASHVEVQALRTQVAHLQDVVEDLRTQLDSVITVLDEADLADITRRCDGKPLAVSAGNKRPRTVLNGADSFTKVLEAVKPVASEAALTQNPSKVSISPIYTSDTEWESGSLGSLSEADLVDVNELLELKESKQTSSEKMENQNTKNAVRAIAEATNLDESSVTKVLRYFADAHPVSSSKQGSNLEMLQEHFQESLSFKKIGQFAALPAQKVGAN